MIKDRKSLRLFAIAFGLILTVIFALVMNSELIKLVRHFEKETGNGWNAVEEYPFSDAEDIDTGNPQNSGQEGLRAAIDKAELFLKTGATSSFLQQMPFVILTKTTDRYLWGYSLTTSHGGTDSEVGSNDDLMNLIVEDKDGMLYFVVGDSDVQGNVRALSDFSKEMQNEGRNFLFVEIPVNAYGDDRLTKYPDYYKDFSTEVTDSLLDGLENEDIPFVSMSMDFYESGLSAKDIFLKTDHHWLPQSGLRACRLIAEWLNNNAGYNLDADSYSIENYNLDYCKYPAFGTLGNKLTHIYAIPEKMPLITPLNDGDLTVFMSLKNEEKRGTVFETLYDSSVLDSEDIYKNRWVFYAYEGQGLMTIHNNRIHDGSRILLFRNSFGSPIVTFMSDMAEYIDVIQPDYFDGSIRTFIDKTNPDTIIVAYTVRQFQNAVGTDGEFFNFS